MRVSSITASRERKINLGNYESADAFASCTVELAPGESVDLAYDYAFAVAQYQVLKQEAIIRSGDEPMPITKLQQYRRAQFPIFGNVRKGGAKGTSKTRGWQGGDELDYFRVEFDDAELQTAFDALYGDKPREIRCMLLHDEIDDCLHAWQEMYNAKGELTHRCNGETIVWPKELKGKRCEGGCKPYARLYVWFYELGVVGLMRVRTTSQHDIVTLTNQLEGVKTINGGRLANIPLVLKRVQRAIKMVGKSGLQDRWMVEIEVDGQKWSGVPAIDDDTFTIDEETGEVLDDLDAPPPDDEIPEYSAPQKPNLKYDRPWRPEDVRQALIYNVWKKANERGDGPANNAKRGATVGMLDKAFTGKNHRHAFLLYTFGFASSKELTDCQSQVVLDWLGSEENAENATTEARQMARQYWRDRCDGDDTAFLEDMPVTATDDEVADKIAEML